MVRSQQGQELGLENRPFWTRFGTLIAPPRVEPLTLVSDWILLAGLQGARTA